MTSPRIVKQAGAPAVDTFTRTQPGGWGDASIPPSIDLDAQPVPQVRATRDAMPVVNQIRALLVFACFMLAGLLLTVIAIGHQLRSPLPGGTVLRINNPTMVNLSLFGDPALDYMAHVVLADGTERDVQLGAYLLDSPVRITLHANAPDVGTTTCRIVLDGLLATAETAQDAGTATCEWVKP